MSRRPLKILSYRPTKVNKMIVIWQENSFTNDNPGCPIEWFHFECVGLVDAPVESGFALNVLFNIFKAITLQKCSVAM